MDLERPGTVSFVAKNLTASLQQNWWSLLLVAGVVVFIVRKLRAMAPAASGPRATKADKKRK